VIGVPNSAIALALVKVAGEKNRIRHADRGGDLGADRQKLAAAIASIGSTTLTARARPSSPALTKQGGRYMVLHHRRYAFGLAVEADATSFIKAGRRQGFLGSARHPLNSQDFSVLRGGRRRPRRPRD